MAPENTAVRIQAALTAVLPAGVEVRIVAELGPLLRLQVNQRKVLAAWVGEGRLRHIRELTADHRKLPDIAVGRRLSPGARALLREKGLGWADESGGAEIAIGTLIVSRTGLPARPATPAVRWTRSMVGIAEALLTGTKATVAATADATGLSTGSCIAALKSLTRLGLLGADALRGRGSSRRVNDRDKLLDAYADAAAAMTPPETIQLGVLWRDVVRELITLGQRWDEVGIEWAATGGAAAAAMAPLLTTVTTAKVYVAARTLAQLEAIATRADLKPIEGGRLTLAAFPTTTTQRVSRSVDGMRVAPWPRVYVDLQTAGVRGEEAAEHLREAFRGR